MTRPRHRWTLTVFLGLAVATCASSEPRAPEPDAPTAGFTLQGSGTEIIVICTDETTREHVRGILMQAMDDGLREHLTHLFEVWMKDPGARDQPYRASIGAQRGISAYLRARTATLNWMPPQCDVGP